LYHYYALFGLLLARWEYLVVAAHKTKHQFSVFVVVLLGPTVCTSFWLVYCTCPLSSVTTVFSLLQVVSLGWSCIVTGFVKVGVVGD
jgi:hypothetical protein